MKEKGGETPFMMVVAVWSLPWVLPGSGRWRVACAMVGLLMVPAASASAPTCCFPLFGNQQPAKRVSSEACLLNRYRKLKGAI